MLPFFLAFHRKQNRLHTQLGCGMPARSTSQVEMTSPLSLDRIQLLPLQALGGQVTPRPGHAPTICFPSVISGGTNPNSAASQLPPCLLLVCLFNSKSSKWGAVPKINLSLTGWVSGGSLCSKGEEKNLPCGILKA